MAKLNFFITSSIRLSERIAVLIGFRPVGFSSITETSMSPKLANASDRGIGVAVITKTSTKTPLSIKSER